MAKKRIKVPPNKEVRILVRNKHTCCICRNSDREAIIHHIDGNPSNNKDENLAVLCLDHASKADAGLKKGKLGAGKKFTAEEIKRYKELWENKVSNEIFVTDSTSIEEFRETANNRSETIILSPKKIQIENVKIEIKNLFIKQERLSIILSKCLETAKLIKDESSTAWIERELYSYSKWQSKDVTVTERKDVSDKDIFPDYRSIIGKFYFDTGKITQEVKLRIFISFSVFRLEQIVKDMETQHAKEIVMHMPPPTEWIRRFPKIFANAPNIPVIITISDFKGILESIRQRAHKYVYSLVPQEMGSGLARTHLG